MRTVPPVVLRGEDASNRGRCHQRASLWWGSCRGVSRSLRSDTLGLLSQAWLGLLTTQLYESLTRQTCWAGVLDMEAGRGQKTGGWEGGPGLYHQEGLG